MNSIISWVGGKKALRDLIYLRMPKNYDRYIEVFTMILIQILQTSFIVSRKGQWHCFGNCPSCRSTPEMNLQHCGNF